MASLDMSLDDMIKNRRNSERGRGQGRVRRGRGHGAPFRGARTAGAPRRTQLGMNSRPSAFRIAKPFRRVRNFPLQNGLFEDSLKAVGLPGIHSGTKLHIFNLDSGVSNEDIRELFSEVGELIRYGIHFDKNGRPSGSAEVLFARRSDAFQALKRYNNMQLDGKPMKIEIVGVNAEIPLTARVNVVGGVNGPQRTVVMTSGRGRGRAGGGPSAVGRGAGQRIHGNLRGGRGRGRGRGGSGGRGHGGSGGRGKKGVEKSADELDKDLENYHAEAMQT